jgi:xanthine phosphoribosyltransferase
MVRKVWYSDETVNGFIHYIIRKMSMDNYKPDYVVGINRGGLVPALKISHYLNVPMHTLNVSLRDNIDTESNCWMAEDAFNGKNILIVDDINDTGATLNWIKNDWQTSCMPLDNKWDTVWHNNVKFAVAVDNQSSDFEIDFEGTTINKMEEDVWVIFPWEEWWK